MIAPTVFNDNVEKTTAFAAVIVETRTITALIYNTEARRVASSDTPSFFSAQSFHEPGGIFLKNLGNGDLVLGTYQMHSDEPHDTMRFNKLTWLVLLYNFHEAQYIRQFHGDKTYMSIGKAVFANFDALLNTILGSNHHNCKDALRVSFELAEEINFLEVLLMNLPRECTETWRKKSVKENYDPTRAESHALMHYAYVRSRLAFSIDPNGGLGRNNYWHTPEQVENECDSEDCMYELFFNSETFHLGY